LQCLQFRHNIILFGEAGAGKSSIVNMLARAEVAQTSNDASGCTFQNKAYDIQIADTPFRIFDTTGLNKGEKGRIPHTKAVQSLYSLIRELDGVSLLIYCMKGRVIANARANWMLFHKVICREHVPIIAVVTGLEEETNMDDWWERDANKETFKRHNMKPKDVACVVAIRGSDNKYGPEYERSRTRLENLIEQHHLKDPWSTDTGDWYGKIYESVYDAGICFFATEQNEFVGEIWTAYKEFITECGSGTKEA